MVIVLKGFGCLRKSENGFYTCDQPVIKQVLVEFRKLCTRLDKWWMVKYKERHRRIIADSLFSRLRVGHAFPETSYIEHHAAHVCSRRRGNPEQFITDLEEITIEWAAFKTDFVHVKLDQIQAAMDWSYERNLHFKRAVMTVINLIADAEDWGEELMNASGHVH
jgi:hypothetical protein